MVSRNHVFYYGSPTSARTAFNASMISDLIEQIRDNLDEKALEVTFPDVLYDLREKDPGIEIRTGDHLQTMRLSLRNRFVKESRAVIFADKDNETIKTATHLFKQVLDFAAVEVCHDYTKAEVIDKLASIHKLAKQLNSQGSHGESFVVAVVWIGD